MATDSEQHTPAPGEIPEVPATADDRPAGPIPSGTFVQSFERGLSVIRAFSADRPRLTLSDVARAASLPRAASRRFLLTLETLGYVRSDGRTFYLQPRVLDLAYAYLSSTGGEDLRNAINDIVGAKVLTPADMTERLLPRLRELAQAQQIPNAMGQTAPANP